MEILFEIINLLSFFLKMKKPDNILYQIWMPARQTDVTVSAKNHWGENHIRSNHLNASVLLVVTSLCLTDFHMQNRNW